MKHLNMFLSFLKETKSFMNGCFKKNKNVLSVECKTMLSCSFLLLLPFFCPLTLHGMAQGMDSELNWWCSGEVERVLSLRDGLHYSLSHHCGTGVLGQLQVVHTSHHRWQHIILCPPYHSLAQSRSCLAHYCQWGAETSES